MIKANELMIGNWILFNWHGVNEPLKLSPAEFSKRVVDDECKDLTPIPLTPEILERCGFNADRSDGNFYKRGEAFFSPIYNRGKFYGLIKDCGKEFEYLHQLQNLYFALTGEELKVNLTEPQTT